jgi:predicted Zn-dependent protease
MVATTIPRDAMAQGMLRDAETEKFIKQITRPIFEAASLTPESIDLYLIGDDTIQAFVTGGQNIFIHSGLILKSENVNWLIGVLAHETGHISGGHLIRRAGQKESTAIMLAGLLLGAAAILAGAGDAGAGLLLGGQSMAYNNMLTYSRGQESSTDQAAITFLERMGVSGRGFLSFFEMMRRQEMLRHRRQDPYSSSHPLNSDRILQATNRIENSPFYDTPPDPINEEMFQRIKAKLYGYTYPPRLTFQKYPLRDLSIPARYARVYGYQKAMEWDKAIEEAKGLIALEPENPYFYEITGQMLMEKGKVRESLSFYRDAAKYAPREPLIMTSLGHALVTLEDKKLDKEAIALLEQVIVLDPINDFAWRQLGTAYARNDMEAEASLCMAEMFSLYGQFSTAVFHAQRAFDMLDEGTPKWIRSQDVLMAARVEASKMRKKQRRRIINESTYTRTRTTRANIIPFRHNYN